ncbi:peptidase MA family metallohydrolase [Deinococcus sonorensis]|uniref:Peptidase MA family metallohydrolase n=1 Tax=Deinococcus sonorensis TaxID=309891 RepID=A0ABV8YBE8_9DEIO
MTFQRTILVGFALFASTAFSQRTPQDLALALQTAVRTGNAAAYRHLLAPNGTFTVEGANFAADLQRHPIPDAKYTFSDVQEHDSRATATLTLVWTRPPDEGNPPEGPVRVTLPVLLTRVDEVWRYAGELFTPLNTTTGTLLVLKTPGLAARMGSYGSLPTRAAQAVKDRMGLTVPKDVVVKVYPDFSSLGASVYLSLAPSNGWTEPGEAIKFVMPSGSTAETQRAILQVLAHEFTHSALGHIIAGPNKKIPWWLHEGMANYAARDFMNPQRWQARHDDARTYARVHWLPLSSLSDFTAVLPSNQEHGYGQGLGVVEFLVAKRGKEGPMQLAKAYARSGNDDAAAKAVGFASFDALESAVTAWLTSHE